jgi:hypothetical protein
MEDIPESFVHVLLFGCSQCGRPVPSAVLSENRNVEDVDAGSIIVTCPCGWSGRVLGVEARGHWVNGWPTDGAGSY